MRQLSAEASTNCEIAASINDNVRKKKTPETAMEDRSDATKINKVKRNHLLVLIQGGCGQQAVESKIEVRQRAEGKMNQPDEI